MGLGATVPEDAGHSSCEGGERLPRVTFKGVTTSSIVVTSSTTSIFLSWMNWRVRVRVRVLSPDPIYHIIHIERIPLTLIQTQSDLIETPSDIKVMVMVMVLCSSIKGYSKGDSTSRLLQLVDDKYVNIQDVPD